MICNKCGAENEEGTVFCGTCGARLDGKIKCPTCGKYIDPSNVYCPECGARTDGKKTCPKCGSVVEGKFCPKCGTAVDKKERIENVKTKKILSIVSNALFLCAVAASLLFIFLIGWESSTSTKFISNSKSANIFYLFGKKNEYFDSSYNWLPITLYIISLLLVIGFATIAAIKSVPLFKCENKGEIVTYSFVPVIVYFAFCLIVKMFVGMSNSADIDGIATESSVKLNPATVAGLIISVLLFIAGLILHIVVNYDNENKKRYLTNAVTACIGVGIVFVLILFIGSTGIDFRTDIRERSSIYSSSYNESYIEGRDSIVRVAALLEKKSLGLTTMLFGIAAVALAVYIAIVALKKTNSKTSMLRVILSSSEVAMSIVFMIFTLVLSGKYEKSLNPDPTSYVICTGSASAPMFVGVIIFAVLLLASSIVACVLEKKTANAARADYNYEM